MEERSAQPPAILAGDAEREHSTQLLSQAVVEGRLTLEEFSDRVGRAQAVVRARVAHPQPVENFCGRAGFRASIRDNLVFREEIGTLRRFSMWTSSPAGMR